MEQLDLLQLVFISVITLTVLLMAMVRIALTKNDFLWAIFMGLYFGGLVSSLFYIYQGDSMTLICLPIFLGITIYLKSKTGRWI